MRAAVFKEDGSFEIKKVADPEITKDDELVIRVLVSSICGTDVHLADAASENGEGKIFGHEFVGEIVKKAAGVKNLEIGDRVVVNPNSYCGECHTCRAGFQNHCENMELMGITHPGSFSEYVKSYSRLAFRICKKLPLKYAVFAEPLSCALNGFDKLGVRVGGSVLILGCGPIGLLFANLARLAGGNVVCIEPNEKRRAIAEKLGFMVWSPFEENILGRLKAHWGHRAEFIIDVAGKQLAPAVMYAEFHGKILCFASPGILPADADLRGIQGKELNIIGSFIINHTMPRAVELLESRKLELDPIITHVLPLEKLQEGIRLMKTGEGAKIIVTIGTDNIE